MNNVDLAEIHAMRARMRVNFHQAMRRSELICARLAGLAPLGELRNSLPIPVECLAQASPPADVLEETRRHLHLGY